MHECKRGCGAVSEPSSKRRHWLCPTCKKVAQREYTRKYRARTFRDTHAENLYGNHRMRADQYDAMWAAQGGRCAGCGTEQKILHVDHDHNCCVRGSCEKCRRGLLCGDCNRLLGLAKDNPAILRTLAAYVEGGVALSHGN